APDDGEARDDVLALVCRADPGEIDESPIAAVAPDEGQEPATFQDAVAVEVCPLGPASPAALAPDAEVEVRRYTDEPELLRIEPEAFFEQGGTMDEERALDGGPREAPAPGQCEGLGEVGHAVLALRSGFDEARFGVDGQRDVAQPGGIDEDLRREQRDGLGRRLRGLGRAHVLLRQGAQLRHSLLRLPELRRRRPPAVVLEELA